MVEKYVMLCKLWNSPSTLLCNLRISIISTQTLRFLFLCEKNWEQHTIFRFWELLKNKLHPTVQRSYNNSPYDRFRIYRWLDFHFSLRDVKEVDRCDKLLVFSGDQLVILVLEMAEYPERSVNNIFMLNDEFKLVKTQEMYFLFDRLPHYEVENQFYILRCLALGKYTFLVNFWKHIWTLNFSNLFGKKSSKENNLQQSVVVG